MDILIIVLPALLRVLRFWFSMLKVEKQRRNAWYWVFGISGTLILITETVLKLMML